MAEGAKLRVRGSSGAWWVVSATAIVDGSGGRAKVVATIEEARTPDVVPLVVAAVGFEHYAPRLGAGLRARRS